MSAAACVASGVNGFAGWPTRSRELEVEVDGGRARGALLRRDERVRRGGDDPRAGEDLLPERDGAVREVDPHGRGRGEAAGAGAGRRHGLGTRRRAGRSQQEHADQRRERGTTTAEGPTHQPSLVAEEPAQPARSRRAAPDMAGAAYCGSCAGKVVMPA